jgi:hypothetical protein
MKLKATASPRGGVESSRKRTDGLQDDEPDSAGCGGEPTALGRSLRFNKSIGRAEATIEATIRAHHVVGGGTSGRQSRVSRETCRAGEARQESEPA